MSNGHSPAQALTGLIAAPFTALHARRNIVTEGVSLNDLAGKEFYVGEVRIRDLVKNSLRMRPDRIIVGEVRGPEALDMLQAMNTGHDGSLTTVHANAPRDALARIETMVLMAGYDLPLRAIRQQVASALDLIVHLERMEDGGRRVTAITEVQRMESEVITLQEIFAFKLERVQADRTVVGQLETTGLRPTFLYKFEKRGVTMPNELFAVRNPDLPELATTRAALQ
jgi:pilus assembly protein CpaF